MAEKGGTKILGIFTIGIVLISILLAGCIGDDSEKKEDKKNIHYFEGKIYFQEYFNMSEVSELFENNNISLIRIRWTDDNLILDYYFNIYYKDIYYNLSGYVVNYYEKSDKIYSYITVHYKNKSISDDFGIELVKNGTQHIKEIIIKKFNFEIVDEEYWKVIPPK